MENMSTPVRIIVMTLLCAAGTALGLFIKATVFNHVAFEPNWVEIALGGLAGCLGGIIYSFRKQA